MDTTTNPKRHGLTRRQLLQAIGLAGGAPAVYETMVAMGLAQTPHYPYRGLPLFRSGARRGRSVVVLGAGIGGLTAAYELRKARYTVEVLDAAGRVGGRSYTVRRDDKIEQIGRPDQTSMFDEDQYFNAGPGRLPHHHQAILDYCRELSVKLQVYVMETRANFFQTPDAFGGEAVRNRRVANDSRGYIAELLAKAVNRQALDKELAPEEQENLLSLLSEFGKVRWDKGYRYEGSRRSGYVVEPGVEQPWESVPPLPLKGLLRSKFWLHHFYQPEDHGWQPTLFEPVGEMDKIVQAFEKKLEEDRVRITRNAQVVRVENSNDGVRVFYRDSRTGLEKRTSADYCISSIPLPLLRSIISNDTFDGKFKSAVSAVRFADSCKVAWQSERFWESREDQIYGGISWINHPITQMWYPSADYFATKGVLTGAYNFSRTAREFGNLSLSRRLEVALEGAERVHPRFRQFADINLGLSIAWQEVPYQEGAWADWDWTKYADRVAYLRLLEPDKRFHVCGDQVSYLSGWQEGAVLSAHHVVRQISGLPVEIPAIFPETRTSVVVGAETN